MLQLRQQHFTACCSQRARPASLPWGCKLAASCQLYRHSTAADQLGAATFRITAAACPSCTTRRQEGRHTCGSLRSGGSCSRQAGTAQESPAPVVPPACWTGRGVPLWDMVEELHATGPEIMHGLCTGLRAQLQAEGPMHVSHISALVAAWQASCSGQHPVTAVASVLLNPDTLHWPL